MPHNVRYALPMRRGLLPDGQRLCHYYIGKSFRDIKNKNEMSNQAAPSVGGAHRAFLDIVTGGLEIEGCPYAAARCEDTGSYVEDTTNYAFGCGYGGIDKCHLKSSQF